MESKLVFLDIDGTLVDNLEYIHPSTEKAVELARNNGHRLFISSGRQRSFMPNCLAPYGFIDGVFAAGASVICGGKRIYDRVYTPDDYDRIVQTLIRHRALIVAETFESDFVLGDTYTEAFRDMKEWVESLGGGFIEKAPKGWDEVSKFIYKDADCTPAELQSELSQVCNIVPLSYSSTSVGGEIMIPGVNKSVGISKVLEYYGADIKDTIAVGDGGNDIEMLEFCGVGIAMGNASDSVKAHADMVTDRIENDGLYKAFEACGLI